MMGSEEKLLVGILSTIVGGIVLRIYENRQKERQRLIERISQEQALLENVAYIARQICYEIADGSKFKESEINLRLFEKLSSESKLTVLAAELQQYGISGRCWSVCHVHSFRRKLFRLVLNQTDTLNGSEKSASNLDEKIKDITLLTKDVAHGASELTLAVRQRLKISYFIMQSSSAFSNPICGRKGSAREGCLIYPERRS